MDAKQSLQAKGKYAPNPGVQRPPLDGCLAPQLRSCSANQQLSKD
jgi:hypothetical protein